MSFPSLSIVTPSYNQAEYLEDTIKSVINQNYPNLEYIIIDGNSTDESIDVIKRYEEDLDYWVSEKDSGQYNAINKGFEKTKGDIMAWINSDDKYTPWAFSIVADIFSTHPEIEWLTTDFALMWDKDGRAVRGSQKYGFNRKAFFNGEYLPRGEWFARDWIQQESTFWRRSLWDKSGAKIDDSLKMAGDFDLWARFFQHSDLYVVSAPIGGFRRHLSQKTSRDFHLYLEESREVLNRYGGKVSGRMESSIRQFFYNLLGQKAIPKSRLNALERKIIEKIPLFYPVKKCVWKSNRWDIIDAYII